MRPPFDIAADLDTPVSAFLKLGPLRPRFLLESVDGGERLGRYSFLGFGDARSVRLTVGAASAGEGLGRRSELTVDGEPVPVGASADPLAALRAAIALAPQLSPDPVGLRFTGGLVGHVNYDFVRTVERLPAREPGEVAAFVAPCSVLVFDHVARRIALLHAGDEAERRSLAKEVGVALRGGVPYVRKGAHGEARASLSRSAFCAAVEQAKEHISAGDLFQLVLASRFEGACDLPPFQVYRALRLLNPSPYLFYVDVGDRQLIGSSPEALVRLEGREATLRPIAGTRPRGADEAEDRAHEASLLADPKEAAEHVMLVDLARNDLGRVAATGTIRVDPYRTVERYSHVMHLVSGVKGRLAEGKDALDLFAAAFPAGTVTGAPKVRAMERIDELEPVARGPYAGTVGWFGHRDMDQAIAIRTLVMEQGTYAYTAGAGIVADSVPEREHDEILAKGAAVGAALRLAEEGL